MRSIARAAIAFVPLALLLAGSCLVTDEEPESPETESPSRPGPSAGAPVAIDVYGDEADHDAPVSRVEAELLDSTEDVLHCGYLMVREELHFRLVRVVDGPAVPNEFVARVTCPERMKRGERVRLELQPMVAHPDVYDVVGEPVDDEPFVEAEVADPAAAAVTVDAAVAFVDEQWPSCASGPVVKPVSFEIVRVVSGKLPRPHVEVLWSCPRELRQHELRRLTLRPIARKVTIGPPIYVVEASVAPAPLPHTAFDPGGATAVVEARLLDATAAFAACDASPRAALAFHVDRLVEGRMPDIVVTAVVACPVELELLGDYRLTLRPYPELGSLRNFYFAADVSSTRSTPITPTR